MSFDVRHAAVLIDLVRSEPDGFAGTQSRFVNEPVIAPGFWLDSNGIRVDVRMDDADV